MKPSRRGFLKSIGAGFLANGILSCLPLRLFAKSDDVTEGIEIEKGYVVLNAKTQKNMEALANTLVPWARELDIRRLFMDKMRSDHGLAGFFDAGLWNLNSNSINFFKTPFFELETDEQKKKVIDHIIARNYAFYSQFRKKTIEIVFSNPTIWKKISYNGPPQPRGFMDYSMSPKGG
jgi:hypothetical protein